MSDCAMNVDPFDPIAEELHLMKTAGIVEVASRNASVMDYIRHWEGRTEKAESALSEAATTIARQQVMLDRALEASFDDKARADRAEAENARLKDPRTAARMICDEVLQKPSDEAAAMREAMVKATMGTKVPALTGEVRWSVVNDALQALAALARPHDAAEGDEG